MAKTFTPRQQNWKWYQNDAAEPTLPLANENVAPQLNSTVNIIRLRVTVAEIGGATGSGAITLEYSTNDSTFTAFSAANHWNYANGAATAGGTTTTFLTTDGTTHGLYHEDGTLSETWAASAIREMDIAIAPTANATRGQLYYFRVLIAGTAVPLNTGETHPQLTAEGNWGMLLAHKRFMFTTTE